MSRRKRAPEPELLDHLDELDELEPVSLASRSDTLALFGGRGEALAVAVANTRDADDADRAARGGMLNGR